MMIARIACTPVSLLQWINLMHESYINNSLIVRMIHDDEDTKKIMLLYEKFYV